MKTSRVAIAGFLALLHNAYAFIECYDYGWNVDARELSSDMRELCEGLSGDDGLATSQVSASVYLSDEEVLVELSALNSLGVDECEDKMASLVWTCVDTYSDGDVHYFKGGWMKDDEEPNGGLVGINAK